MCFINKGCCCFLCVLDFDVCILSPGFSQVSYFGLLSSLWWSKVTTLQSQTWPHSPRLHVCNQKCLYNCVSVCMCVRVCLSSSCSHSPFFLCTAHRYFSTWHLHSNNVMHSFTVWPYFVLLSSQFFVHYILTLLVWCCCLLIPGVNCSHDK